MVELECQLSWRDSAVSELSKINYFIYVLLNCFFLFSFSLFRVDLGWLGLAIKTFGNRSGILNIVAKN